MVSFRQGCVQGRITPLKTEASRTNLPLPEEVLELLRQWRSVAIHRAATDWVFASPYTKGKRPFWPAQLLKAHIKPIALAAGLPNIGWHSFRHTVSAWGKEAGLELEEVKTLLRHENLATTSEVYGDLGDGGQAADSAADGELRQAAGHTHSITAGTHSVNLRDPYLTQIVFADSPASPRKEWLLR